MASGTLSYLREVETRVTEILCQVNLLTALRMICEEAHAVLELSGHLSLKTVVEWGFELIESLSKLFYSVEFVFFRTEGDIFFMTVFYCLFQVNSCLLLIIIYKCWWTRHIKAVHETCPVVPLHQLVRIHKGDGRSLVIFLWAGSLVLLILHWVISNPSLHGPLTLSKWRRLRWATPKCGDTLLGHAKVLRTLYRSVEGGHHHIASTALRGIVSASRERTHVSNAGAEGLLRMVKACSVLGKRVVTSLGRRKAIQTSSRLPIRGQL